MNNLNQMKRVLNRHGLQLNLNVNEVLGSKNNYELAKWFKALIDRDVLVEGAPGEDRGNVGMMSRTSSWGQM
jgi:hypothetical protein